MIKINLGCGWRNFGKDWYHIDGGDYSHLDSHDILNLPFDNGTVDLIYASHVIEYFDRVAFRNFPIIFKFFIPIVFWKNFFWLDTIFKKRKCVYFFFYNIILNWWST